MPQTETRSLHQIKRETEQTRAGLTNTVEQLRASVADTAADIRQRVRPEAIKAEVSGYIKSRGEQLLNDAAEAARSRFPSGHRRRGSCCAQRRQAVSHRDTA